MIEQLVKDGLLLVRQRKLTEALQKFNEALDIDPNCDKAYFGKGEVARAQNHLHFAIEMYNEALKLKPNNPLVLAFKGYTQKELGEHTEAHTTLLLSVSANAVDEYDHTGKAVALHSLERDEEAVSECNLAIEINPRYAAAYCNKGVALSTLGKSEEAILVYTEATKLEPLFAWLYNNIGVVLHELHRDAEALEFYAKAIVIDTNFAKAYDNQGISLRALGRDDEASGVMKAGIKIAARLDEQAAIDDQVSQVTPAAFSRNTIVSDDNFVVGTLNTTAIDVDDLRQRLETVQILMGSICDVSICNKVLQSLVSAASDVPEKAMDIVDVMIEFFKTQHNFMYHTVSSDAVMASDEMNIVHSLATIATIVPDEVLEIVQKVIKLLPKSSMENIASMALCAIVEPNQQIIQDVLTILTDPLNYVPPKISMHITKLILQIGEHTEVLQNPGCIPQDDDISSAPVEPQKGSSTEQKEQKMAKHNDNNKQPIIPESTTAETGFRQAVSHSSSTSSLVEKVAAVEINAHPKGDVEVVSEEEVVTGEAKKYVGWKSETVYRGQGHQSLYEDEIVQKFGRETYDNFMTACKDWAYTYWRNVNSQDIQPIIENARFTIICDMQNVFGKEMLQKLFIEWIDCMHNEYVVPLAWISEGHKVPFEYGGIAVASVCEADGLEDIFNKLTGASEDL